MAPPFDLNPPGSAATRGWGRGWPEDRRRDMAKVVLAGGPGAGDDLIVWVHHGIAPLVAHLMQETEARGYDLRPGQCWGYANRAIRGTSSPSNHSWGLGPDLNAPSNPMTNHLVTDMPPWMPQLWKDHGFRWGGDYGSRKDAMHYEFMGTPAEAQLLIADLSGRTPIPDRHPVATVTPQEAAMAINAPARGFAPTPSGRGYYVFAADGGVFNYGDAVFRGALADRQLNSPIVGGAVVPDGSGYWMVGADGGVFAFNAPFFGSMGNKALNRPVEGMAPTPDGAGYWLFAEDGGVFAFGSAAALGSPA